MRFERTTRCPSWPISRSSPAASPSPPKVWFLHEPAVGDPAKGHILAVRDDHQLLEEPVRRIAALSATPEMQAQRRRVIELLAPDRASTSLT